MKRRFASKNECTSTFSKPSNFGRKRSTIGSIQNGIKITTCIATRENLNILYMSTSTRNISRGTAVKGKPSKVEIPYSLYDHQQSVTLDKDETTIPKDDVSENLKNVSSLKGENDNGSQPSSTIQGGTGTGQRQHIIERMRDKLSRTDMRDTAVIMAHASTQIAICKYISIFLAMKINLTWLWLVQLTALYGMDFILIDVNTCSSACYHDTYDSS